MAGYRLVVNEWSGALLGHTNVSLIDPAGNKYTFGANIAEMDFNAFNGYEGGIYRESSDGAEFRTEFEISQDTFLNMRTLMENQAAGTAANNGYYNAFTTNCVDAVIGWLDAAGISYDATSLFNTTIMDGYSTGRYYLSTIYDWVRNQVDPAGVSNYDLLDDIDRWREDYWDATTNTLHGSNVAGEVSENEQDLRDHTIYSPIAIDLNGDGLQTIGSYNQEVSFDLNGDGLLDKTAWLSREDGFLAIDLNNDNSISNGNELFGGAARGEGYAKLSTFDSNNDGFLDATDESFKKFLIWKDSNSNGISDTGELSDLASFGITSIDLNYVSRDQYNHGNLIGEHSSAIMNGTQVSVGDIYFQSDIATL